MRPGAILWGLLLLGCQTARRPALAAGEGEAGREPPGGGGDGDGKVPERCASDADCDDGRMCNGAERCAGGTCRFDGVLPCDDRIACTRDVCLEEEAACEAWPDHAACGADQVCDPDSGCVAGDRCAGDEDCQDGFFCNGVERCRRGQCEPGEPLACDDGVACTQDVCVESDQACRAQPDDAACDDGAFCNGGETCDALAGCRPGAPPACDDDDPCTEGACAPETDRCVQLPLDADGDGAIAAACGDPPGDDCDDRDPFVRPGAPEACNGADDDCDGVIDDGVLSECGDCDPGCRVHVVGGGDAFPVPGAPGGDDAVLDGVNVNDGGDLVLDSTTVSLSYIWPANSNDGSVSKIDVATGYEVARYDSVLLSDVPGVQPTRAPCRSSAPFSGNCPSRTAVDYVGNVWVANRAFGTQGSVTKIAAVAQDCVDRNGNGRIDTSNDRNGNGLIDVDCDGAGGWDHGAVVCRDGGPPEFFGQDDECIQFSRAVGGANSVPRALAIDAGSDPDGDDPGNAWVGAFSEQRAYQFSSTGELLTPGGIPVGVSPYGMAIDSRGRVWMANSCCGSSGLRAIDAYTRELSPLYNKPGTLPGCRGQYGIAVDADDNVWQAGWPCAYAYRFDPDTEAWTAYATPAPSNWGGRGIAVDSRGFVWMSVHRNWGDGGIVRIRPGDGQALLYPTAGSCAVPALCRSGGVIPVGIGIDFRGNIWTVNQSTESASRLLVDAAGDPVLDGAGRPVVSETPVGSGPYTYSDFTGFGLRTFTRPSGEYALVVDACPEPQRARWLSVTWDSLEPPGTAVSLFAQAGDDRAALDQQPRVGPWQMREADLQAEPGPLPDSRYLRLTLRLTSDDQSLSPVVSALDVRWTCLPYSF